MRRWPRKRLTRQHELSIEVRAYRVEAEGETGIGLRVWARGLGLGVREGEFRNIPKFKRHILQN